MAIWIVWHKTRSFLINMHGEPITSQWGCQWKPDRNTKTNLLQTACVLGIWWGLSYDEFHADRAQPAGLGQNTFWINNSRLCIFFSTTLRVFKWSGAVVFSTRVSKYILNSKGGHHLKKKIKVWILSKGGGRGSTPNPNFLKCIFGKGEILF